MKTNAIVRIVLYAFGGLILSGILLGILCYKSVISDRSIHYAEQDSIRTPVESVEMAFPADQINNIKIDWVAGNITIRRDDNADSIKISEISPVTAKHHLICKQSGQTLKIQFSEESIRFFGISDNSYISKDLLITVPANWKCGTLEVDTAASVAEIYNLTIAELDYDGASGTLLLDNCSISELDIDTASGDVEFIGTLGELSFDAASAKFYGEFFRVPNRLKMNTMSGDLEIILPEGSGFTLDLDTMSNSFDTDFEVGRYDESYICGDGACEISIGSMSSDVTIHKGNRQK